MNITVEEPKRPGAPSIKQGHAGQIVITAENETEEQMMLELAARIIAYVKGERFGVEDGK